MPTGRTRPLALVVALALLVTMQVPALSDDEGGTRLDRLGQELKRIRSFTANAQAKLSNGVLGRNESASPGDSAPTPALSCCTNNLRKLAESVVALHRIVEELDACYAAEGTAGSSAWTGLFIADVRTFGRQLQVFADAPSPGRAEGALGSLTRTFNRMTKSAGRIDDCPAAGEARPAPAMPDPVEKGE